MHLYWVTTEDHDEDWFIVARDAIQACVFHEDAEGYDEGDAIAEWVAEIPDGVEAEPGWPSDKVLLSCGAKFLRENTPRVVEIAGRKFSEGMLEFAECADTSVDVLVALFDGADHKVPPVNRASSSWK